MDGFSKIYQPRDPMEIVKDHLPADCVLLVGKKATGKSQMIAHWAASITDGIEFVPGVKPEVKGEVVIFNGERSIESTVVPRLIAAGVTDFENSVHVRNADTLEEVTTALQGLMATRSKIKVAFIDPLNNFLDGNSPTNSKARRLLKPLLSLCEDYRIAIVIAHHFVKGGNRDVIELIGGSAGWSQVVGSIWAVAKVRDVAILQHLECNDLPTDGQCWEYEFEPVVLDQKKYKNRTKPTSRIIMLGK